MTGAHDHEAAVTGAERACGAIADADGRVKASYGVARWPQDGPDDDGLLAAADVRLYEMKGARARGGRLGFDGASVRRAGGARGAHVP